MINALGCALIGVSLVLITEVWGVHRLIRSHVGYRRPRRFTTFSTYAVGIHDLVVADAARTGLIYMAGHTRGGVYRRLGGCGGDARDHEGRAQ